MKRILAALCMIVVIAAPQALNTTEQSWVDAVNKLYGKRAALRVEAWRNALHDYKRLPTLQKLQNVN